MDAKATNQRGSALGRVKDMLRPGNIIEQLAATFENAPGAFILFTVIAPAFAVVSTLGVHGAIGLPIVLSVPFGLFTVFLQCMLFAMLKNGSGPKVRLGFLFSCVALWNAASLAAGGVALNPDRMGRAMIERELVDETDKAEKVANDLEANSARVNAIATYMSGRAELEGAPSIAEGYVPTCPGSTGPGRGQITTWRLTRSDLASSHAASLKNGAIAGRRAAQNAQSAARNYTYSTHDATMERIGEAFQELRQAIATVDRSGLESQLGELAAASQPGGICPDATLLAMIENAQRARADGLDYAPAFAPPPLPSEAEAIADLQRQVLSALHGEEADLSLYVFWLIVSPLADITLMSVLGMLLARRQHEDDDAEVAERIGLEHNQAALLTEALQAAANDPEWVALTATVEETQGRFFKVSRLRVPKTNWPLLHYMMHLAAMGRVRVGIDDGETVVFVLRPGFLHKRFDQLIRREVERSRDLARIRPRPVAEVGQ